MTNLTPAGYEGRYRRLSLWWDGLPDRVALRPPLSQALDVDVAVVGAGFTGLWTAYYLTAAEPALRVAVLEKEVAGYGASGRNGGWCSAIFAASAPRIARDHGASAAVAMLRAMRSTVDEVGRRAASLGIDCHFAKGGTVVAARNAAQVSRARSEITEARSLGTAEEDLRWLDKAEAAGMLGAEGLLGATYTPHCAALDPARLARGLAGAVERQGARIFEQTPVTGIQSGAPGRRPTVTTPGAKVRGRRRSPSRRGLGAVATRPATVPGAGLLPDDRHRTFA